MHAAPSVSYPVGRSAFAGVLVAGIAVAALLVASYAASAAPAPGWRQALAVVAAAVCGVLSFVAWRRSPRGALHWDGVQWRWEQGGAALGGQPELALDLQSRMLLHWRGEDRSTRWLWVERKSDASHWDALRRAVYSRASQPAPDAGEPPAAEQ